MAITGVHALLYTSEPDAVRAILRDVFGWDHVDAGDGWLVFALPPAELGVHPAEGPTFDSGVRHQLTLMCDDLGATVAELRGKGVELHDVGMQRPTLDDVFLRLTGHATMTEDGDGDGRTES